VVPLVQAHVTGMQSSRLAARWHTRGGCVALRGPISPLGWMVWASPGGVSPWRQHSSLPR
jgi:hypothetical protein